MGYRAMAMVFLSYSRKDMELVEKLKIGLQLNNITVFRDLESIPPGQQFDKAIKSGIRSSGFFVLVWSRNAAKSTEVEKEWKMARKKKKDIIPYLLDGTMLPAELRFTQGVDGRDPDRAVSQIVQSIRISIPARVVRRKLSAAAAFLLALVVVIGLIGVYFSHPDLNEETILRLPNGVQVEFVSIPAGEFKMGSEAGESDEKPLREVKISHPFQLSKQEVTQEQWAAVMGSDPSSFKGGRLPVEGISWIDTQAFMQALNARADGWFYRLPTEAEWEYAARAGAEGGDEGGSERTMWFRGNSEGQTHAVGGKEPNAWGLYDMRGNVWEFVDDWYAADYSDRPNPDLDPTGPRTGVHRVIRGGGWDSPAHDCRWTNRGEASPDSSGDIYGFRLLRRQRSIR